MKGSVLRYACNNLLNYEIILINISFVGNIKKYFRLQIEFETFLYIFLISFE